MSRVAWDVPGDRRFETGLDRGVLYLLSEFGYTNGVAWNGLTNVDERSEGEGAQTFSYDGIRYAAAAGSTDFAASISAITYPEAFEPCVGVVQMAPGVFVTQQRVQTFGFCYRTLLGDDLKGIERGYKLHLVYGATALPPAKGYSTMDQNVTLTPFVWDVTTVPVETPGFKPMAHLVVESNKISDYKLEALENILYGTDSTAPRLPYPSEVKDIMALGDRQIIVLTDDDISELETWDYLDGDEAISIADLKSYVVDTDSNPDISDNVRPVIVLETPDEPIPNYALPGDLIYVESTGDLYMLGE